MIGVNQSFFWGGPISNIVIFVKVEVYYAIIREVNMNLIQAQMGTSTSTAMSASSGGSNAVAYGPGLSPQPGFSYRNVWKPLTISFVGK